MSLVMESVSAILIIWRVPIGRIVKKTIREQYLAIFYLEWWF